MFKTTETLRDLTAYDGARGQLMLGISLESLPETHPSIYHKLQDLVAPNTIYAALRTLIGGAESFGVACQQQNCRMHVNITRLGPM